ncbi:GPI ethanolamine phosphate transferase 3 [[Candida] anglica]|uniref:GPI ethanolamine phosphate transferase 3 n=1 Tax=[Candida] anglica TaxID=148631 RepID=A0ABP0E6T0_9ASCO
MGVEDITERETGGSPRGSGADGDVTFDRAASGPGSDPTPSSPIDSLAANATGSSGAQINPVGAGSETPASQGGPRLVRSPPQQQSQSQGRMRIRQQKLKMTFIGYVMVLVFFGLLQFLGVLVFTQGFLLSRNVLPDISEVTSATAECATYDKMVLLVIDALRFDFAVPVEDSPWPYHNEFPVLYEMSQKYPDHSVLLKFMADPPTTTLQRLKGITTGSLPTFIDAGSNFDGDAIDEDNWLLQLHRAQKSVAFMGDDTWKALFSQYFNEDLHFPYDSLNVHDLHTVDNGVIEHLFPLLQKNQMGKWDVLIGHFLGLDHVGHRFGPNHQSIKQKLNQMDDVVRKVMDQIDDNTLLVVMGDHGMDSTGNHGGDSPDELESTLFMYSKKKQFGRIKGDTVDPYSISNVAKNYRRVNQIDLVPTLSLLLGVPIPFNNLGFPIEEAFQGSKWRQAIKQTVEQIQLFRKTSNLDDDEEVNTMASKLNEGSTSYNKDAEEFQAKFLAQCKEMWATFDLKLITIGILILVASLSFIVTYARLIPSVRVSTMSFEFAGSVVAMVLLGLVLSFSVYVVLRPVGLNFKQCVAIGSSIGIFVGLWAPIMDRFSVAWLWHQLNDFFIYNFNGWSVMAITFILSHSIIFASNSFVVWEDKMISYFISTFGFYTLIQSLVSLEDKTQKILALSHSITFLVLSRIISTINLCREEQQPYCQATFTTTWWSVALLYVSAFALPAMLKAFYRLSDSYHSAAPLWIGTGLTFLLFANAIYWTLEYIGSNSENISLAIGGLFGLIKQIDGKELESIILKGLVASEALFSSLKLAIARISMFITLILANYSWSRGPLCVKLAEEADEGNFFQKKVVILGFQNVYGSSYFLLLLNFAVPIMLVTKPLGALSLCMLLIQIMSLLEIFDILRLRNNLIAPTMFGMLAYQHYFSTGHQATIPSIQWDVGFITTETITFPFTHLNIVLNTFGSFILVCVAVPLITLWKLAPSSKPITVLSQIVANTTSLLAYQTVVSVSSFIFAAHFRRHLMVWKIFAPRFMLSGILLLLMNAILVFITILFATGKLMAQVNRIFGK